MSNNSGDPHQASSGAPMTSPSRPSSAGGGSPTNGAEKKLAAGLLAILLGSLGIHKFYLGYTKEGVIMLLVTLLTCGLGASIMYVLGIVEGVLYLTKSDEEFVATYIKGQKPWF